MPFRKNQKLYDTGRGDFVRFVSPSGRDEVVRVFNEKHGLMLVNPYALLTEDELSHVIGSSESIYSLRPGLRQSKKCSLKTRLQEQARSWSELSSDSGHRETAFLEASEELREIIEEYF